MKKWFILIALLIVGLLIPTVSAITVNETEFIIDDHDIYKYDNVFGPDDRNIATAASFLINYPYSVHDDLYSIQTVIWKPDPSHNNFDLYDENVNTDSYNVKLQVDGSDIGSGRLTYYKGPTTAQSYVRLDVDNIDISLARGGLISIVHDDEKSYNLKTVYGQGGEYPETYPKVYLRTRDRSLIPGTMISEYYNRFTHIITLEDYNEDNFKINIDRAGIKQGSEKGRESVVLIYDKDGNLLYTNTGSDNPYTTVDKTLQPYTVEVYSIANDRTYIGYLGTGEPWIPPGEEPIPEPDDGIPINIRVQNSQTGAFIANAHITISANVNGEFHEVVNETIPAGTKTYNLQPTGGGLPNPDFYRLIVTAEGYNSIMPYSDFEADIPTTIYAYLNPIGGAPVNENKTFIDFYVRDINAKPVAGATVKFGAYTLLTNSAGYTIFEVEKNKTYSWTVSKSGYGSVTGNAIIGSDARHTINAVIAPAVTPTLPTPIPTKTPVKPSPTLTSPTGEPVSNLLEWFAAHFGMILGGGVEIGKIFMWLCFTIPAGVFVGNKARAGAAGFMAGAGIVTLFFVIIGWVPIWLVVILALIIGLLYAKAFSNIGNGGGR